MAEAGRLVSAGNIRRIASSLSAAASVTKSHRTSKISAASRKNDLSMRRRKGSRIARSLIKISTALGRWNGEWSCDYLLSLRDLQLEDLIEDEDDKNAKLSVNLCIQKHASFGLSVDGRITTSFTQICSFCSSPYCREIDTNFNVWVLPSSRDNSEIQLPEIGSDDPSLSIYVKPGNEANLDSLIQDTIRLTASVKDTCSEACEQSEPTLQYIGEKKDASIEKRWSRLLELRK
ncbi:LOW QUALITY PROTEIN: DUF177 domain-containing protein, partial [Cephalotus follicularis]